MLTKSSKYKQSIFDLTIENFGTLDNLIDVSNDNSLSISDFLATNTELSIDNTNLGEADIKKEIIGNQYTYNNNYDPVINEWILATGFWNDNGVWVDTETWID